MTLSSSLQQAGPAGVLIAYIFISTMVYATCISNAEMMSFMPDVGGLVGLADIFVDPALGFTIGWGSWYDWAILIPDHLGVAANLIKSSLAFSVSSRESTILFNVIGGLLLVAAVAMNSLRTERVGSIHSVFALLKLATLAILIVSALIIALAPVPLCNTFPAPQGCNIPGSIETLSSIYIGASYWRRPGPFSQQILNIRGAKGQIMGIFNVLIQSLFAFNGTEAVSIMGRELINPSTNTRIAVRRTWLRITVIYVLAVAAAGLVVPSDHEDLKKAPSIGGSPWTIAFATATRSPIPRYVLVALFSLSALSAASSNIWFASRWLFFLALRGHAPQIFRSLYTDDTVPLLASKEPEIEMVDIPSQSKGIPLIIHPPTPPPMPMPIPETSTIHSSATTPTTSLGRQSDSDSLQPSPSPSSSRLSTETDYFTRHVRLRSRPGASGSSLNSEATTAPSLPLPTYNIYGTAMTPNLYIKIGAKPITDGDSGGSLTAEIEAAYTAETRRRHDVSRQSQHHPKVAIPWVGVLSGGVIGLLFFMVPAAETNGRVDSTFKFLTSLSNCTSLIGWIGMLITYLRFYMWTTHQEKRVPNFKQRNGETIYKNRARGQPWVAVYGLVLCTVLFLGQGWFVFVLPDANQFAQLSHGKKLPDPQLGDFAWNFCAAYLPVGLLLMLYFGYKLTYQTDFVDLRNEDVVHPVASSEYIDEPPPRALWDKLCHALL
ncbi:amino acid permease-domain-containing protein [Auriculariales sp. MPI-PUGE-AT-0066]|nr:amino acid permease-domain-containing protein [Auriculariales sp. MPI-PUGE-AT-0066]